MVTNTPLNLMTDLIPSGPTRFKLRKYKIIVTKIPQQAHEMQALKHPGYECITRQSIPFRISLYFFHKGNNLILRNRLSK